MHTWSTNSNTVQHKGDRHSKAQIVHVHLCTCECDISCIKKINLWNDPSLQIRVGTQESGSVKMGGKLIGEKQGRGEVSCCVSLLEFSDWWVAPIHSGVVKQEDQMHPPASNLAGMPRNGSFLFILEIVKLSALCASLIQSESSPLSEGAIAPQLLGRL